MKEDSPIATEKSRMAAKLMLGRIITTVVNVDLFARLEMFAATEDAPLLVFLLKQTVVALVLILRILTLNPVQEQH